MTMGGISDNKLGCKGNKNSSHQVRDLLFLNYMLSFLKYLAGMQYLQKISHCKKLGINRY